MLINNSRWKWRRVISYRLLNRRQRVWVKHSCIRIHRSIWIDLRRKIKIYQRRKRFWKIIITRTNFIIKISWGHMHKKWLIRGCHHPLTSKHLRETQTWFSKEMIWKSYHRVRSLTYSNSDLVRTSQQEGRKWSPDMSKIIRNKSFEKNKNENKKLNYNL